MYETPTWLPNGHWQTIYPALFANTSTPDYQRERWETPDGDFVDVDNMRSTAFNAPQLVIFHGLEGSSDSHYVKAMAHMAWHNGYGVWAVNFRGCSGELNRLPRSYFAADSAEIDWVLRRLSKQFDPEVIKVYAYGISLGGHALLKWLGEQGSAAKQVIDGAATLSAPVDLMAAGDDIDSPGNDIYRWTFVRAMKKKVNAKLKIFPDMVDPQKVDEAKTLRAFDDVYTAPIHGYRDVNDYWTRGSAKSQLVNIGVRTLMIHAQNDPLVPFSSMPTEQQVSNTVTLLYPEGGGHAGFMSPPFPGNINWAPARVLSFFEFDR